ncbi:DUF817 domain-containing protein [Deinococcus navajonensis]|uniref:DUF817 domain-containing protein n=1 Tax=Deinococcus navajonensis TaxID=309884 RepID=A0ABV8XMZ2_9DEIO
MRLRRVPRLQADHWPAVLAAFVVGQLRCCALALLVMGCLALSRVLPLHNWGIARYDAVLLGCLLAQWGLLRTGFETSREAAVVLAFHGLGFALEAFKVTQGSWSYPEDALSKLLDVPLYAGFMYASVGSYVAHAWRTFDLQLCGLPPLRVQLALAAGAYLNFFTHHYGPDLRLLLTAALALSFRRAWVCLVVTGHTLRLPLNLSFALIGLFVFLAENAATFLGAWVYPHQRAGWQPVHPTKWLAWTLLVVVAFLVVSGLRRWEARRSGARVSITAAGPCPPGPAVQGSAPAHPGH